mmetsp:Transcript_11751/g.49288  ORF Transcript_11751/g.49288 Transcript_11751/m.49288 type:complete len:261 (-) Transcript_11751:3488-4270(-)
MEQHHRRSRREARPRRRRRGHLRGRRRVQRSVHALFPDRPAQGLVGTHGGRERSPHPGRGYNVDPGRPGADSLLEPRRVALRRSVRGERHHRREGPSLAADDRPAGPGEQVDQEHVQGIRHRRHQTVQQGLPPNSGQRHPVRPRRVTREHRRTAGRRARAPSAEADVQAGRQRGDQDGRRHHPLPPGLQVLHDDQDAQPALSARGERESFAAQLFRHARRPGGSAPRHGGDAGAPRPRRGEEPARGVQRAHEGAAQGPRG